VPANFHSLVLSFLRDKKNKDGKPYPLGNHNAIDSLIATHSIIYDAGARLLYVSQGPGLTEKFSGFDLNRSFETQMPVPADTLSPDPDVTPELFYKVKSQNL
jgi:hypothetical protein